jgi:hypothetical protein
VRWQRCFAYQWLLVSKSSSHEMTTERKELPRKVDFTRRVALDRQPRPGDRWVWVSSGTSSSSAEGSPHQFTGKVTTRVEEGVNRNAGRLVVFREDSLDGDQPSQPKYVLRSTTILRFAKESGVFVPAEESSGEGATLSEKIVTRGTWGPRATLPNSRYNLETDYTDGTVRRTSEEVGPEHMVRTRLGDFLCVTVHKLITLHSIGTDMEGDYCPGIGTFIRYTIKEKSSHGIVSAGYEMSSMNMDTSKKGSPG